MKTKNFIKSLVAMVIINIIIAVVTAASADGSLLNAYKQIGRQPEGFWTLIFVAVVMTVVILFVIRTCLKGYIMPVNYDLWKGQSKTVTVGAFVILAILQTIVYLELLNITEVIGKIIYGIILFAVIVYLLFSPTRKIC